MHITDPGFLTLELILCLNVLSLGRIDNFFLRVSFDIVVELFALELAYVLVQVLILWQSHPSR